LAIPQSFPEPGRTVAHEVLTALTDEFQTAIQACFITGSYANGTAVPSSDLDGVIVIADSADPLHRVQVGDSVQRLSARAQIEVSLDVLTLDELLQHLDVHASVAVKGDSVLVAGEDIRSKLALPPPSLYARWMTDFAFTLLSQVPLLPIPVPAVLRRTGGTVPYPLSAPDPVAEFLGYDTCRTKSGAPIPSLKPIEKSVRGVAVAISSLRGAYSADRSRYVETYIDAVGDEWTELVAETYALCKQKLLYEVPESKADRLKLRRICERTLEFENHFLRVYRRYLLELLKADGEDVVFAAKRLGQIEYDDEEVKNSLTEIASTSSGELSKSACHSLARKSGDAPKPSASQMQARVGDYRGDTAIGPLTVEVRSSPDGLLIHPQVAPSRTAAQPIGIRAFDTTYGLVVFPPDSPCASLDVEITGGPTIPFRRIV